MSRGNIRGWKALATAVTGLTALSVAGGTIAMTTTGASSHNGTQAAAAQKLAAASKTVTVRTKEGKRVAVRADARVKAKVLGYKANKSKVVITCYKIGDKVTGTYGTSTIWDRVSTGGYMADAFLLTGSDKPVVPKCGGATTPPPKPPSSRMATIAARYVGGYASRACRDAHMYPLPHYQCKQFVSCVTKMAVNRSVTGGYYKPYIRAHFRLVSRSQARAGDVIQLTRASNREAYYSGMHTAVLYEAFGGDNTAVVVDSNFSGDPRGRERVRKHAWDPFARAKKKGLTVQIWRYAG